MGESVYFKEEKGLRPFWALVVHIPSRIAGFAPHGPACPVFPIYALTVTN